MSSFDWKTAIATLVQCKQRIADRDRLDALPWHLPAVAASDDRIADAERAAGFAFPSAYRRFLAHADGWRGFYVLVDLFGTADIVDGGARDVLVRPEVASFVRTIGSDQVIAIGASEQETDVFLLVGPDSAALPGGVIWWADEEIDRFDDFAAFFTAMIAYNERVAERLADS